MATDVAELDWHAFRHRFDWRQGEHVALVGPTGQGKTTLGLQLIGLRDWTAVLGTKPRDRTLDALVRAGGYVKVDRWPPPPGRRRVIVWPKIRGLDSPDIRRQSLVLHDAFSRIFRAGSWCVFADDVQYLTRKLGLGPSLETFWLQGRSLNLSLMAATQRPRWVPREMWSQSSHLFLWQTSDEDDLRKLGGFGSNVSTKRVRELVAGLARYSVLYIDARRGELVITKAPTLSVRKVS